MRKDADCFRVFPLYGNGKDMQKGKTLTDWSALDGVKPSGRAKAAPRAVPAVQPDVFPGGASPGDVFSAMLGGRRGAVPGREKVRPKNSFDKIAEASAARERTADILEETAAELDRQSALAANAEERAAEALRAAEEARTACAAALAAKEAAKKESAGLRARLASAEARAASLEARALAAEEAAGKAADRNAALFRAEMLERELAQARRLPSSVLLRAPVPGSANEVFAGEIYEHVVEALAGALKDAAAARRDRRAELLEAVLAANQSSGGLSRLREETKKALEESGRSIGEREIANLEKLGFKYAKGARHPKFRWGRAVYAIPSTPSDGAHGARNTARDLCNMAF